MICVRANKRGFVLIISYFIIVILTMLVVSFLSSVIADNLIAYRYHGSVRAFWLAQSAVERAISELNYGAGKWIGWQDEAGAKVMKVSWPGFGEFSIRIANVDSDNPFIVAQGFFPAEDSYNAIVRGIEVVAGRERNIFSYAAFGKSRVDLGGNPFTDSYNSLKGPYNEAGNKDYNGDVGSNGDIYFSGSSYYIGGDASTGCDGVFSDSDHVFGQITHSNDEDLPAPAVPAELVSLAVGQTIKQTQTLMPGNYKFKGIDLTGQSVLTIIGPANIYLTGQLSIDLTGQGKILITEDSGPVRFYVDGDISISGQGVANDTKSPPNLLIFGTGGSNQKISIGGSGSLYGAIYAPDASINLEGVGTGGVVFGSVVGNNVSLSGSAAIHYDEALGALRIQLGKFFVQSWKEISNPARVVP